MGAIAFHGDAAQRQGFGDGFLPAGDLDADMIEHIAPGGNLGHLVDLNTLPEPKLPVGRFPRVLDTSISKSVSKNRTVSSKWAEFTAA